MHRNEAYLFNMKYSIRSSSSSLDTCESCHNDSICVVKQDKTVECICPTCEQDQDDFTPVCGEDYVTYATPCQLRRTACLLKKPIKILKNNVCGKDSCFFLLSSLWKMGSVEITIRLTFSLIHLIKYSFLTNKFTAFIFPSMTVE